MGAERIPAAATIRVPLIAFLASDHVTPATGVTIAITLSKNGAAFGNPSIGATNATEIANGWYYVDLSTTDTGTNGPLIIKGTSATIDNVNIAYDVVNANTGGLSALPDTAVTTNGSLITSGTSTAQLAVSGGVANADMVKISTDSTAADNAESFFDGTGYAGTNNIIPLVTTTTTATNLTNAPTNGDFTNTMKTSIGAAVAASAVASVTGNVGGNVTGSVGSVTAAVTVGTINSTATNVKKNTALANFEFPMYDTAGLLKTGLTVTATRSLDGAAFGACANAVSEVANGIYKISLAAADLNANMATLQFAATGALTTMIGIVTQP